MTDYKQLCGELADALHNAIRVIYHEDGTQHISTARPALERARAALAWPGPESESESGLGLEAPTDEELDKLFTEINQNGEPESWRLFARAVLTRWSNHRPTIDTLMQLMPSQWRRRWCSAGLCACKGCANQSGGLERYGYTQADHAKWLSDQASSGGD